jgi:CDP-diacylglycerol--glycerol-3-phosphate 3-phosphatidyltransferase
MRLPSRTANVLTASRILLAAGLLFVPPLGTAYIVLYLLCGLSDVLDGYIARRTHTQSDLGARLDSIADLVFIAAVLISLYPILRLPAGFFAWIAAIAEIRLAAAGVVYARYRTFSMLHTWGNKLTGILLFLFPLSLAVIVPAAPLWVVCTVATLSAVEELLIDVSSKELHLNRRSIFTKK